MSKEAQIFVAVVAMSVIGLGGYFAWTLTKRNELARAPQPVPVAAQPVVPEAAPAEAAAIPEPTINPLKTAKPLPPPQSTPQSTPPATPPATAPATPPAPAKATPAPVETPPKPQGLVRSGMLLFRHTAVDANYGSLAIASLADLTKPSFHAALRCEAVHFSGGRGICMSADRGVFTTYAAHLFDNNMNETVKLPLEGVPSRTRVATNGEIGVTTVFVSGHSYAAVNFSTATKLIDMKSGRILADMESFAITKDGQPFQAKDFNFWGVTFERDSNRFYCTLSTGGKHYLVHGNVAQKSGQVIHENVECPSLSPDGTRIAYKKRFVIDGRIVWQLHVLELPHLKEVALAEKRNLDDQIEWLDRGHVLYSLPAGESSASTNVWSAPADGTGTPLRFLANAYSPAVVR